MAGFFCVRESEAVPCGFFGELRRPVAQDYKEKPARKRCPKLKLKSGNSTFFPHTFGHVAQYPAVPRIRGKKWTDCGALTLAGGFRGVFRKGESCQNLRKMDCGEVIILLSSLPATRSRVEGKMPRHALPGDGRQEESNGAPALPHPPDERVLGKAGGV